MKLGRSKDNLGRDIISADDYAAEIKLLLEKAYKTFNDNLYAYHSRMTDSYDKAIKYHEYAAGDKVWLRKREFRMRRKR